MGSRDVREKLGSGDRKRNFSKRSYVGCFFFGGDVLSDALN